MELTVSFFFKIFIYLFGQPTIAYTIHFNKTIRKFTFISVTINYRLTPHAQITVTKSLKFKIYY